MRNRMAVISFKSEAVTDMVKRMTPRLTWMSFNSRARDTQALYMMEPMITAVVDFTNPKRLNSWVPMMTLANPMTMVPVPMEYQKSFLLAVHAACQGRKAIGNGQAHDFHHAFVFGQGSDKHVVVAHSAQEVAGTRL